MRWLTSFTGYVAPLFLMFSPVISYADQAYAMHRSKSSAGFSLDIPLIMLVASMFRLFYYPRARYDQALFVQALFMILTHGLLLKIALDYRPAPSSKGGDAALPFAGAHDSPLEFRRPYNFWRWRSTKPYWQFLLYLFISLTTLELILSLMPPIYALYYPLVGYVGLTVEATLPIPQILANARSRSCRGFRVSLLASWIGGDMMKMFWFFTSTTEIPWAFKLCGMFQASCDLFLGLQYFMYGDGDPAAAFRPRGGPAYHHARPSSSSSAGRRSASGSGFPMAKISSTYQYDGGLLKAGAHNGGASSGRDTPTGRRTPILEKQIVD